MERPLAFTDEEQIIENDINEPKFCFSCGSFNCIHSISCGIHIEKKPSLDEYDETEIDGGGYMFKDSGNLYLDEEDDKG